MPRDVNGNYTLPAGNPVAPQTIIETDWANPTMEDIANALTDSLSRTGEGGMLVPFLNADGVEANPGIAWTNEPQTGFYRASAGVVGFAVGGKTIFTITTAGIQLQISNPTTRRITQADGSTGVQLVNANDAAAIATAILQQGGANYLPLTGGTLSGPLAVPTGATGFQVPQRAEVDQAIADAIAALPSGIATGTVLDFAGGGVPSGYLMCDGAAVSRTTYAALFNVIGVLWGAGDGVNTFNVPQLNGTVTIGAGVNYPGIIGPNVGNRGGASTHTLTTTEIPPHSHTLTEQATGSSGGQNVGTGNPPAIQILGPAGTNVDGGGGGSHNNMQPSAVVLKIIKT